MDTRRLRDGTTPVRPSIDYARRVADVIKAGLKPELLFQDSLNSQRNPQDDNSRCGFRYNARGISRRYYCHECERKFFIRIVHSAQAVTNVPAEVVWLLDEVGLQVTRLNELLVQLDLRLTQSSAASAR